MKFLRLSPRGFANEYKVFATTDKRAEELKEKYRAIPVSDGYVEEITEHQYRSHSYSAPFAVYMYEYEDVTGGYSFGTVENWDDLIKEIGE